VISKRRILKDFYLAAKAESRKHRKDWVTSFAGMISYMKSRKGFEKGC